MIIDYSDFEVELKGSVSDEDLVDDEGYRVGRTEMFYRTEECLPSGVLKIGSVEEKVDNWRSWDGEIHFYLLPLKQSEYDYALLIINWDDNWNRYNIEVTSRIKGEKDGSKAELALVEDWIKTRNIDVSEGSPYLKLLKELSGE